MLVSVLPLLLRMPWGARLASAAACAGVALAVLGSWTVANGLRYDDYTVARGTGAFFPFYRAFTTDHIVRPGQRARLAGARERGETERAARGALPLVRDHPRRVLRARRAARVRGRGRDHRPTLGMGLGLRAHACRRHRGGQGASARVPLRCGEDDLRGAVEAALRRSPERRRRSAERPGAAERDVAAGDWPRDFRCRRTER